MEQRIIAAAKRIGSAVNPTPLLEFSELNERASGRVLLKPENLQRTGSFKIRGAYNAIACLSEEERRNGILAFSSGNHAQGVALAARSFGVASTIVMPEDAPETKMSAVKRLGAEVITYDRYTENREAITQALADERGCPVIPSYDYLDVIAGQGTIGLEVLSDPLLADGPPDQMLVCCGGGGLVAGISVAIHASVPDVRMYAVEPSVADDTARSIAAGERLANDPQTRSVCDAILTPTPGALTFPINMKHLSGVLTVSDEEALYAVGYAMRRLHLVVEPGGAVALAAAMFGKLPTENKTTVLVLSGGNLSDEMRKKALAFFDRSE
ncbi:MAG: threonine/serine dehydratase [Woeseiaceae bacterium]